MQRGRGVSLTFPVSSISQQALRSGTHSADTVVRANRLRYGTAASVFRTTKFLPLSEGVVLKGISDIKYNPNYHKVIVTSASMGEGLAIFSPKMWDAEDQYPHPQWDLGGCM